MIGKLYPFVLIFIALTLGRNQATGQPVLSFEQITSGLNNPVDITDDGSNRLYIVQQGGLIRLWNGSVLSTFLDLSSLITNPAGNEQGLLSLAFHPGYSSNRYFFVWYTGTGGILTLARYRRDAINPDIADPASGQILFTQAKPGTTPFTNHNGAKLNFGPDGYLYIGTGDGGSGGDPFGNAQNGASYLGKMLRIDVNGFASSAPFYDIPPTNPFLSTGDGILDEIYAIGLRNPWRWSFDRTTGDMWIADVGQNAWEEVNYLPAGSTAGVNYGWSCYEGSSVYVANSCNPPGTVIPVLTYPHNSTTGGFSITGGYVYRGSEYPALQGYYITADYVSGNLWTVKPNGAGGWLINMQTGLPSNISTFGEGADGKLYAAKRNTGILYKVVLTSVVPVTLTRFDGSTAGDHNLLEWSASQESAGMEYQVEYSRDGRNFNRIGRLNGGEPTGFNYRFKHYTQEEGYAFYRLKMQDPDGSVKYSNLVRLTRKAVIKNRINPNVISQGQVSVNLNGQEKKIQLYDSEGRLVWQKDIHRLSGITRFGLPALSQGIYYFTIHATDHIDREKILIR